MLRFVGVIIDIKGDQDFLYTRESTITEHPPGHPGGGNIIRSGDRDTQISRGLLVYFTLIQKYKCLMLLVLRPMSPI